MDRGFVQLNGQTYELAYPATESLLESTRLQLEGAAQTVRLEVRIEGVKVDLFVRPSQLWASAVWLVPEVDVVANVF